MFSPDLVATTPVVLCRQQLFNALPSQRDATMFSQQGTLQQPRQLPHCTVNQRTQIPKHRHARYPYTLCKVHATCQPCWHFINTLLCCMNGCRRCKAVEKPQESQGAWQQQFSGHCAAGCHPAQGAMRKDQMDWLQTGTVRGHSFCQCQAVWGKRDGFGLGPGNPLRVLAQTAFFYPRLEKSGKKPSRRGGAQSPASNTLLLQETSA